MSTQVTIVICAFIIGVVIIGIHWMDVIAKNKEVVDFNDVQGYLRCISGILGTIRDENREKSKVTNEIKANQLTALARMEKQQSVFLDLARMMTRNNEHLDGIEKNVINNVTLKRINSCIMTTNSEIATRGENLSSLLHAILNTVDMNKNNTNDIRDNITSLIKDIEILNNTVSDNGNDLSNIYSEVASIDSRLNSKFGEDFIKEEANNE